MAERALGLAAKELKDIPAAVSHLRRAIRIAEAGHVTARAAEARMSLALVLAYKGDTNGALREADRAAPALGDDDAARLQMQRALILQRLGRTDEALEGYRRALLLLRRNDDREHEARLLNNRALLHAYRGSLAAAERDLRRAEQLHVAVGQELAAAETRHNLGFVAGRRGDVPAALHWFDVADAYFREQGVPRGIYLLDRCEVLLAVPLIDEALAAATQAVEELERGRMAADLAEARLILAEAHLLARNAEPAAAQADLARRAFLRQQRPGWAALAAYANVRAASLTDGASPALLRAIRRTADQLDDAGWSVPALDARLMAARTATALGRGETARRELDRAARARREARVAVRARAWHAQAVLRAHAGNRRGAYAAVRAGLRLLDEHRAALGATELRAHASAHASELGAFGLRLALADGRAARVLAWAERWRAGSLRLRPVRPPDDAQLADDLAELRRVVGELERTAAAAGDARRLLAQQARAEERIRRRTRSLHGRRAGAAAAAVSVGALANALGDRALIEYIQVDEELFAVTLVDARARLRSLGAASAASAELESLRFCLRRLAHRRGTPRALETAVTAAAHAAERLDELLVRPLAAWLADRTLVVIPTGALHALPWGVLPSLGGRPIAVAPSAALWHRAATQARATPARVVLAAGPGLPGALCEIDDVARHHPGAQRLARATATAEAVRAAIDGAALAHIAAHGSFRADNPLFSSLRLWDGPLTVYDLETLHAAPQTLVLSACDSGLHGVRPGDELMGLSAALLSLGTATIVASLVPVPDEATRALMTDFHRRFVAGAGAAAALAAAQAAVAGSSDEMLAAAAGFVCLGAG